MENQAQETSMWKGCYSVCYKCVAAHVAVCLNKFMRVTCQGHPQTGNQHVERVCCSVLQCVTVCCSALHHVAACCSVLRCVLVNCNIWREAFFIKSYRICDGVNHGRAVGKTGGFFSLLSFFLFFSFRRRKR